MIIYNVQGEELKLTKNKLVTTDSDCHVMSMHLVDFKPKGKCLVYIVPLNRGCMYNIGGKEGYPSHYRSFSGSTGSGRIGCQSFDAENFSKIVKAAEAAKKAKKKGTRKK